jgi:hypothetical protein
LQNIFLEKMIPKEGPIKKLESLVHKVQNSTAFDAVLGVFRYFGFLTFVCNN